MRGADHLFAAVVSWVISVRKTGWADLERPFQHRWEGNSRLPYTVFRTENVHRDFLRRARSLCFFEIGVYIVAQKNPGVFGSGYNAVQDLIHQNFVF